MIDTGREGFRVRLRESLARHRLSQTEVARRVGVERAAVNAWVKGRRTPDLETTRKLAAIFGWPIPEMLSWFGIYEPLTPNAASTENASSGTHREAVTTPVTDLPHLTGVPLGEEAAVSSSLPQSSSHLVLYGLIGKLSESEADELIEPLLKLVRQAQRGEIPPQKRKA